MGGKIWVESHGHIGGNPRLNWLPLSTTQGSIFYFEIALSVGLTNEKNQKDPSSFSTINSQIAAKYHLRILLVEDNPVNQKVASIILRKLPRDNRSSLAWIFTLAVRSRYLYHHPKRSPLMIKP
jgi:hypothetical protein